MTSIRRLLPLYCVIFLGFFGYALTITLFIPMLLDRSFPILPTQTSISVRAILSGILLAMYPLGQFFASPIIGRFSDHFGRKKILIISLIACIFGFLGMSLSIAMQRITFLFIFSFITGLSESNMAISQSVIADTTEDMAEKTKLIGYAYSACSLGYIIGPLVGGFAGTLLSYSAPFWITSIGIVFLILWIAVKFSDSYVPNESAPLKLLEAITAIKSIFNRPKLSKVYLMNFLIFFSVMGLYRVVPLYIQDNWNPSLHIYSLIISFVSLLCFLANLFLLKWLAQYFSTRALLAGLLILGGVLVIFIVIPKGFNWIWFTYGAGVIPTVMALPTCTTWLSKQADPVEQGQVLGNNQALLVLGESSSAAIGGLIAGIIIPLPIVVMGVILFVAGGMSLKLIK